MESINTKESSPALAALSKHKNRGNKPQNVVVQPAAIVVENPKIEVTAPSVQEPEKVVSATPEVKPETKPTNLDPRDTEEYKSFKKYHDKTVHELRTELDELKKAYATATTPKLEIPKTKEEIEAFRKQHPDAVDIFTSIAIETNSIAAKELQDKLAEVDNFRREFKEKEAFKALLEIHPDAMEIRASTKFKDWYNEQPKVIQQILSESTDITAVAKQLTLYKLEVLGINPKDKKKEEVKEVVDASLGVDVKGKPEITAQKKIWTATEINNICADYKLWNKYSKEIDAARREGRVDLTK